MNLSNNSKGSISTSAVSDQFPAGLRVLVVDDDRTCLTILERMLRTCPYDVTKCNRAEIALSMLRSNKNRFDIVLSDVRMPDMDGFKLLEHIGLEMDLPVIMMSADDSKDVVMKGVTHGACDYLIKPVRIEALRNIWQHVVRKRKNEWKDMEQSGSVEEVDRQQKQNDDADYSSSANEGSWRNSKKRKDEDDDGDDRDDSSTLKKPRVVWSVELHQQFVAAVNQLGIDKAVPKKILELMNVPGLTRENVASHLQKYRLYLRRLSGVSQHQGNIGNPFISPQEVAFGQLSSLNGIDLQTLAVTGHLPVQSLATLQSGGIGRPTVKSGISMPIVDQRNLFSFENPKIRFGEGQQQQHMSNNNKQMNLLHGIPTGMEPKQLASLHHSAPSIGSVNIQGGSHGSQSSQSGALLMHMAQSQSQSQSRGQMLNEGTGSHVPQLSSSLGQQPIQPNGYIANISGRNGIPDSGRGTAVAYNPVSQTSSMLNFPLNQTAGLGGNSFPIGNTSGLSTRGTYQEEVNSDIKRSGSFIPSYDIFNDLNQHKPQDWELQNVGLTYDASQQHSQPHQPNIDVSPSVLISQGFSSSSRNEPNGNASSADKSMFSGGERTQNCNVPNVGQHLNNTAYADNSIRVKSERFSPATCPPLLYPEQFGQEDLMSALLKQQEGIVPAENEFDFDGYSMDNISV